MVSYPRPVELEESRALFLWIYACSLLKYQTSSSLPSAFSPSTVGRLKASRFRSRNHSYILPTRLVLQICQLIRALKHGGMMTVPENFNIVWKCNKVCNVARWLPKSLVLNKLTEWGLLSVFVLATSRQWQTHYTCFLNGWMELLLCANKGTVVYIWWKKQHGKEWDGFPERQ